MSCSDFVQFDIDQYNNLWDKVDAFILRVNPCNVIDGKCLAYRKGKAENFCCSGCSHLTCTGCGARKPLSCRSWLCAAAIEALSDDDTKEYDDLWDAIYMSPFFGPRKSLDDLLANHKSRYTKPDLWVRIKQRLFLLTSIQN